MENHQELYILLIASNLFLTTSVFRNKNICKQFESDLFSFVMLNKLNELMQNLTCNAQESKLVQYFIRSTLNFTQNSVPESL